MQKLIKKNTVALLRNSFNGPPVKIDNGGEVIVLSD